MNLSGSSADCNLNSKLYNFSKKDFNEEDFVVDLKLQVEQILP